MESLRQWADPELAAVLERTRPSIEIRSLHNMINRYLAVTMPQEARIATGGNTHIIVYLERHRARDIFQYDIEQRFSIHRIARAGPDGEEGPDRAPVGGL